MSRPWIRWLDLLIALFILGAGGAVAIWGIWLPTQRQGRELASRLEALRQKRQASIEVIGGMEQLEPMTLEAQRQLRVLSRRFLAEDQLFLLERQLHNQAQAFDLGFGIRIVLQDQRFLPGPSRLLAAEDLACYELPVRLQLTGPFQTIGEYLDSLHELPFLLTVQAVELERPDRETKDLTAHILLVAYSIKPR